MFKDLFAHIRTISHQVNLPESLVKLMPSNNSQVAGYLPPAAYSIPPTVYDQLIAFKAERGLESVEMAVSVILEEYFGLTQTPMDSGADTTASRLETLEAKCTSLTETVAELQRAIAQIQDSSSQSVDYKDPLDEQTQALLTQDIHATAEFINSLSVELESAPSIQEQPNFEQRGGETFSTPMTRADLAKRLGVATSTVSRMQSKPNFPDWSKQRDPDAVAWVKSADSKLFYPQSLKVAAHTRVSEGGGQL